QHPGERHLAGLLRHGDESRTRRGRGLQRVADATHARRAMGILRGAHRRAAVPRLRRVQLCIGTEHPRPRRHDRRRRIRGVPRHPQAGEQDMRAAYIVGKQNLEIRETPAPDPGAGQVRVRIDYVGICGSDLHYYYEGANGAFIVREPLIPGHEVSGRIDAGTEGEWPAGTPVTVHPARFGPIDARFPDDQHLWAGGSYLGSASTWPHTQGGLSEYLIVERRMVRMLD